MTPAQLTTLKNAIVADSAFNGLVNNTDGASVVAAAFNAIAVPDFIVWRTDIKSSEIVAAVVGTEFAALTAIKQTALMFVISPGVVDASSPNVQNDFSAIFSAGPTLTALAALAKRQATRFEKLFATGTGSTASPGTMVLQGAVSIDDVNLARHS